VRADAVVSGQADVGERARAILRKMAEPSMPGRPWDREKITLSKDKVISGPNKTAQEAAEIVDSPRAVTPLRSIEPVPEVKKRRIRLITDAELDVLTPPPPLIQGIISTGGMSAVFGQSTHYKSFFALDMDCCIASGMEYNGRRVQQGSVVYIAGEGIFGMQKRLRAWKQFIGYDGTLPILFLKHGIALQGNSTDVIELIDEIADKLQGIPPVKITIDTLARNFVGNESASEDMNSFVAGCSRLQEATGAHIQIVHHSGWSELERLRGSSVLHCALDTEILCTRDGSRLTVECKKQKDDNDFPSMTFEALPVAESLVLNPMAQHAGKIDGNRARGLTVLAEANGPISYTAWMKNSGMEDKKSSFKVVREWALNAVYAKQLGDKYEITEAGRQAWNNR
jgi:hypothetical protein